MRSRGSPRVRAIPKRAPNRSSSPTAARRNVAEDAQSPGGRASSLPPNVGEVSEANSTQRNSSDAQSAASGTPTGAARRGLVVQWNSWVPCCYQAPLSDNESSWIGIALGNHKSKDGGEQRVLGRSCFAHAAELTELRAPLGFQRLHGVPQLSQEAAFDVSLGKPLERLLPKSKTAREEAYVLCRWPEKGEKENPDGSPEVAKGSLPFGFAESPCQNQHLNVQVMVHMDEMRMKGIYRLFSEVSLAPECCEVWWQLGPQGGHFASNEDLGVELQSLDVDESAFDVSNERDNPLTEFDFLRPHQVKSVRWMMAREISEEPFLADWHVRKPLSWQLRERRGFIAKDEVVPPHFDLGNGPTPLQLEYRLENRYVIRGGVLADPIGSGKTATCLTVIASMSFSPMPEFPVGDWRKNYLLQIDATLLIVPDSVHHQWPAEVSKWPGLAARIEITHIRSVNDLLTVKLRSAPSGAAHIVLVPFSIFEASDYIAKLHSPMTSAKWKTQVWSFQHKLQRENEISGLALEAYCWRRVIIDEFHEFASVSTNHKGGQRILRFLQSHARWGVSGTPEDLLKNLGAVQCAAKIFQCEFNSRRCATAFCEQYYRSSRLDLNLDLQHRVVNSRMNGDERFIYLERIHGLDFQAAAESGELPVYPWDQEILNALTQILQLCSHFAPTPPATEVETTVKDAKSAQEAARSVLLSKSDAVSRWLGKAEVELRHFEGGAMSNEDIDVATRRFWNTSAEAQQKDRLIYSIKEYQRAGNKAEIEFARKCWRDYCASTVGNLSGTVVTVARKEADEELARLFCEPGWHDAKSLQSFIDARSIPMAKRVKSEFKCSACRQGTCCYCVAASAEERPSFSDCSQSLERFHRKPMSIWRVLDYFYKMWCLVNLPQRQQRDCIICLETKDLIDFSLIQCGHLFCTECMASAISTKKACPMCREPIGKAGLVPVRYLRFKPEPRKAEARGAFSKYGNKLEAIVQSLQAVKARDRTAKVVLFSQWQTLESKIASALSEFGLSYLRLTACRDLFEKRRMIEAFQDPTNENSYVLLLSLDGHASGTNLSVANHVFLVHPMVAASRQQQIAYEKQAIGRAARLGQTRTVTVWRFIVEDTLEEIVYRSLTSV